MALNDADNDQVLAVRRRQLSYRASHRGTREMDFLLGRFAAARLPGWGVRELAQFEALISEADPDIGFWIFVAPEAAPEGHRELVAQLRHFHGLKK